MEITIKCDEFTVIIDKPELITWTEAVESFVIALRGCGFQPHDFEFVNGNVTRLDDIEDDEEDEFPELRSEYE